MFPSVCPSLCFVCLQGKHFPCALWAQFTVVSPWSEEGEPQRPGITLFVAVSSTPRTQPCSGHLSKAISVCPTKISFAPQFLPSLFQGPLTNPSKTRHRSASLLPHLPISYALGAFSMPCLVCPFSFYSALQHIENGPAISEFEGIGQEAGGRQAVLSGLEESTCLSLSFPIMPGAVCLGYNLKNDRMISVHLHGKPFYITVIQVYAPTTNAKEAERFYKDLKDLLELTPRKDVHFITGGWNAKVGSQEIPGVAGKFGLGVQNQVGQRLTEFCQENALVIANTLFQQHKRRLYTWTSPDCHTKIRFIIFFAAKDGEVLYSQQKKRLGADCGSDHELIIIIQT